MNADDLRALEVFPTWLRSLNDDAVALAELLAAEATPEPTRRALGAGLNYLFKSLDLIPDGLDDLGFLDDAFVLRIAARQALAFEGARAADGKETLDRLAGDARFVESFLGRDAERL
ncbi:MAG: YkvA family protein, partial [Polyangiales bacterium]